MGRRLKVNEGKKFEQDFIKSCAFYTLRLKDGGGWSNAENTRFTSSNICDFIAYKDQKLFLIELKSCIGTSIPYTAMKQIDGLNSVRHEGVHPVLILNFRKYDQTFIVKASKLVELRETCGKKSFSYYDAQLHGRLIPQSKKISRYTYDTSVL
jgi:recombination protein U